MFPWELRKKLKIDYATTRYILKSVYVRENETQNSVILKYKWFTKSLPVDWIYVD